MTTFLAIAQNSKLEIVSFSVAARGKLERIEGAGHQVTQIVLKPRLMIRNSRDLERASRILEKAERNCLSQTRSRQQSSLNRRSTTRRARPTHARPYLRFCPETPTSKGMSL